MSAAIEEREARILHQAVTRPRDRACPTASPPKAAISASACATRFAGRAAGDRPAAHAGDHQDHGHASPTA
jgi:hypothetical protein